MVDSALLILWGIALVLGLMVARRGTARLYEALSAAAQNLVAVTPRICAALLLAGFVAKLVPSEAIGHAIGYDTGWRGIALATVFGGMMPSGPMIAFPVVVVLRHADAGVPQIVAFLTAWSVFAWHRVLTWEVTLLGWQLVVVRLTASLTLPLIAGALALALCATTGYR